MRDLTDPRESHSHREGGESGESRDPGGGRSALGRRTVLATAAAATAALFVGGSAFSPASGATPGDQARLPADDQAAGEVRDEFLHGWQGYCDAAWGYDEAKPVSGGHNDFFAAGHTFGLSIVEALDTLYLMGEDAEVSRGCDWVEAHFDPAQDASVHVFEAVIRLVGGLLTAYRATGRQALLDRCRELADRLLRAYTASPTGIPYTHVNLRTGAVSGTSVPLAEVGTSVMEFGTLSQLVGDSRYYDASMRAYRAVLGRASRIGLLGSTVHAETGRWLDAHSSAPNPPVDSFYEYLWTGSALLGDAQLASWYRQVTAPVLKYQSWRSGGRLWFRTVDMNTGKPSGPTATQQSELGSFYAGLLAKAGDTATGADYFRSWSAVLDRWPVLPETVDCATLAAVDGGSQLRPEYANSAFDLWRVTGGVEYKQAAYRWFDATRSALRVPGGYTVATDVTGRTPKLGDLTPAYWFAENLKYLYLMYSATPRFDYASGLLSTEAKPLRGLR